MEPPPSSTSSRGSRPARRTQRQLPALTPAPPSSASAAAPLKLEPQPTDDTGSRPAAAAGKKPSSLAHIFFNRRPLDLIRRTTSSLLASGGVSAPVGVVATPPAVEERKFWQPHRPLGDKAGRRRLQQLQLKEKDRNKDDHKPPQHPQRRLRVGGDVDDAETERRKKHELEPRTDRQEAEIKRTPAPCPPSGKQFLLDADKAVELTALERAEILQYDEIRFVSTRAVKRSRRDGKIQNNLPVHGDDAAVHVQEADELPAQLCNDGYDDEHGDYLVLVGDHLAFRYEVLSALGHGSFGQVVCCLDHRTRKQVAVKIIRNRRKYRDQALVEVQLLAQLQRAATTCHENPHVVRMEEYFLFRDHVCIAFEVLGTNLYDFLKLRYFHGLPMSSVRTVGKQLAQALTFLKQQHVVHCDLKPENVLLDASALAGDARNTGIVENVTLIDFGSSCLEGAPMFTYIQSRFYRSPEVLLGHTYSGAIDMWSFACILVELHTGHPIFAGENECEQFACIMEVLGVPPTEMVLRSKRRLNFFDEVANPADFQAVEYVPKPFVNSRGRRRTPGSRSLISAVKSDDAEFLELLAKCFVWDPSQRLTPEQALEEPWMRHRKQEFAVNPVEYEL
ncbi:Dual specificity tyrosine-phosphorylation-regulated kinase 4 [Phytophthora rubi]|uniref:Dual specificity tyrosine-phosphorylation-regulated kinase 4 n=1 Tax=Phytophthora rubi TaxID=129364 RepID=A0A6A3KWL6_9STRA|nr:Dual specificity tyrosine-phosphorylation-regulated kinase 4 [Phytophthora rubi]KAE9043835.1 Dual specificity tyrosine-phosphorylation-regulated kinase 4 [Phytophthora rubi]KAE9345110.1 Dual specificity tyrosine-phosphorylation-regulated kinase 4 [Phytophthora rubi]